MGKLLETSMPATYDSAQLLSIARGEVTRLCQSGTPATFVAWRLVVPSEGRPSLRVSYLSEGEPRFLSVDL